MQKSPYSWQPAKNNPFAGLVVQKSIFRTYDRIRLKDILDHLAARLGINRMGHKVAPGLYKLGKPGPESRVFVTANYTLSFDALRFSLKGLDAYILVLETFGINVWCAAGKGTFGTEELIRKIEETNLAEILSHRNLILPQLGAPGVSSYVVKERTGFNVKYGPVKAGDIPEYLRQKKVSDEARRVRFTLKDRLVLIPVEFRQVLLPMLVLSTVLFFTVGLVPALALAGAAIAGTVLFPALLPWLPTKDFSSKGFFLGGLAALAFALVHLSFQADRSWPYLLASALAYLTVLPPITSFLSLNFTGASTFTSRTGVKKEIKTYFPAMVWMVAAGILFFIASVIFSLTLV